MTASMDLAALVLLDVLRFFAVDCLVTSILIGVPPALLLSAVLLKAEIRRAGGEIAGADARAGTRRGTTID
jgi:hypothetical protein